MKSKSTLLFLSILLLVLMIGVPTAQAQFRELNEQDQDRDVNSIGMPDDGGTLVLRVEVDFSTFDLTPSPGGGGAFYISGVIFNEGESSANGDEAIGRFDCWGWITADPDSPGFVSQEWNLFGVGKLLLSGAEDAGPRAITGGTGQFSNVRGQANITIFWSFRIFSLSNV